MKNSYQSISYVALLLLVFSSLESVSATDIDLFLHCLSTSAYTIPKGQLANITYTPSSKNYTIVLQDSIRNARFNTSTTLKPNVIVTPSKESQVQDIVLCAKKVGLQLRIRSGGHDYDGLSYTSKSKTPFVVLDMFNLRSITINMKDETACVQAGATLGELYYKIWENSKTHAFPAGVCPTIGVGGHFSGGGYGNMMRKYGISVDNVIDAQIVDAKGQILDRKGMGEDVFWAIRGGGGASFGVILSYKLKLVRVPPVMTVFNVPRTLEQNATDLVHRWQYIAPKLEKDLFMRVQLDSIGGEGTTKRTARASFNAMFLGDSKKLVSLIEKEFPELGLKKMDCTEMSWIQTVLSWSGLPLNTPEALLNRKSHQLAFMKMKSDYVKSPISKDGLEGLLQRIAKLGNIMMQLNPYGGKMSEIPESAIAFPHRAGILFKIQYIKLWTEEGIEAEERNINELRKLYEYMTPFVSKNPREAFLNYRDIDIGSKDNGPEAYEKAKVYGLKYFKNNFDRLVKVKTEFDPDNFFSYEQSIPTLKETPAGEGPISPSAPM